MSGNLNKKLTELNKEEISLVIGGMGESIVSGKYKVGDWVETEKSVGLSYNDDCAWRVTKVIGDGSYEVTLYYINNTTKSIEAYPSIMPESCVTRHTVPPDWADLV